MKYRYLIILLLSVLALFSEAPPVSAHATPITYTPESSSVLTEAPERVVIRFSERIDPPASNITVFDPNGNEVDDNQPQVDSSDSHIYSVGVSAAEPGTYTVAWQVVSADDGHFTKGAYSFSFSTVSSDAVSEQSEVVFLSKVNEGLVVSVELIGQGILWGALIILVFFRRHIKDKYFLALLITGSLFIVVGSLGYIAVKSQDLALLRSLDFLSAVKLFAITSAGKFALSRSILAVIFLLVFVFTKKRIFSAIKFSTGEAGLFLLLILAAAARVASSHAAAAHFLPIFTLFDHIVHMIFKGLWVGLALSISVLLLPSLLKIKELNLIFPVLNKLSRLLSIVFGVVGITGAYIVWLDLKDPVNIQTTDWGMRFVTLSVFGGILLMARLYNHVCIEWSIIKAAEKNDQSKLAGVLNRLKISYPVEAIVGITLLIATGFIMITTPPVWNKNVYYQSIENQGVEIALQEHPTETDYLRIGAKPLDSEEVKDIVVTLTNFDRGIGPIVAQVEKRSDTSFVLSKNQLSPPGLWKIDVTVQKNQGYNAIGSFDLNFPNDIEVGRLEQNQRIFGLFEWIVIVNVIGILLLATTLLFISRYVGHRFENNIRSKKIAINEELTVDKKLFLVWPLVVAVLVSIWFAAPVFTKSNFQRMCEKDGNFWHNMLPTRSALSLSQASAVGCMIGNGQFHIGDREEYQYFVRPVEVSANLGLQDSEIRAGVSTVLTFSLKNNQGEPMRELTVEHERLLHTMIVGEDFSVFSHIHPDDTSPISSEMKQAAAFPVTYTFPKAGKYLIAIDFAVKGQPISKQFLVDVAGAPLMGDQSVIDTRRTKNFEGYDVGFSSWNGYVVANEVMTLQYRITRNGQSITDLEPYLGAAMHLAIVKSDLSKFIHTHGEVHSNGSIATIPQPTSIHYHPPVPGSFGPDIEAHLIFPESGTYVIFGEFKHMDKVVTTSFTVEVE